MNKQAISKLNLFLIGLTSRFSENSNIFKNIKLTYKAGLKNFKGLGEYDNGNIRFNFNGITNTISISELVKMICGEASNYDSLILTYSERGTDILIEADNKNVKMKNIEV